MRQVQGWQTSSATGPDPLPRGAAAPSLESVAHPGPARESARVERGVCRTGPGVKPPVEKVVCYPPLPEISAALQREFHEALSDADVSEDLPAKCRPPSWQASPIGWICGR
jgi:hypothetical protein